MGNTKQDSQSELTYGYDPASPEGDYSALTIKHKDNFYNFVGDEADVIEAYVTTRAKEALETARSEDPYKCEFGHEVYSHNTVDGWCCACEADQAFMEGRVKEAEELLRAEVNFYKDRCKMERNKYDILAKSTQEKIKEAERLARIDAAKDATQSAIYVLTGSDDFRIEPGVNLGLNVGQITKLRQTLYRMKDAYQAQALTTTTNGKEA